jgi:hypothetical protein
LKLPRNIRHGSSPVVGIARTSGYLPERTDFETRLENGNMRTIDECRKISIFVIKNDLTMTETIDKQTELKRNWVTHPTKRNLLIIVIAWLVGNGLLILASTDLFTESLRNQKYILIYAMMVVSTAITLKVVSNFFRTRGTNEKS